jgi:hypothetical protein
MVSPPLIRFVVRAFPLVVMFVVAPAPTPSASAQALRLVDADGIVHVTNVPGDPRYRDVSGISVARAGRLSRSSPPAGRYAQEIREISRQYEVDPLLVEAVVRTESAFDRAALSRKGAAGLMQLMPATASALGVLDRFDPAENIRGGVRHLRYLLDRYHGQVAIALAAYNAGEGAVDAHGGIPPYPETEQYVQRVLRLSGLTATPQPAARTIYRYLGPADAVTYSNLPPGGPGRAVQ